MTVVHVPGVARARDTDTACQRLTAVRPDVVVPDVRAPCHLVLARATHRCRRIAARSARDTRIIERLRNPPLGDRLLASFGHQEQRILSLLAEGLTNRQIAKEMFLADQTVKHDVSNTLTKLGMSRRPEAAVYAARHVREGGGPTRAG